MDTKTVTLGEFLLARIDEDERDARRFLPGGPPWLNRPDARRIAECEAKRRIVELHAEVLHYEAEDTGRVVYCATCGDELDPLDPDRLPASYPCPTLRLLALPYADHPDYDEAWRP